MFNDVKLQVDYESKMAYKLLRLVKKQLKEGYYKVTAAEKVNAVGYKLVLLDQVQVGGSSMRVETDVDEGQKAHEQPTSNVAGMGDEDSDSEVEEVVNETSGFISSKSGGGIGRKNLYEHWKDDYDDNPYDYPTWGYGLRYKFGEKRRGIGGEDIMAVANDVPVAGFSSFQSPSSQLNQSLLSNNIACSLSLSSHRKSNQSVVPKASSTATYSPEIGDVLGSVDIFTASGESVLFNDLWDQSEGIAVVALLRHFGCPCCWELASTLKESISKFEAAGVKLIAIGIGEPKKARVFAERLPFPLDSLYADPERKAYNLLGLYYGIGRTFFNPASAKVLTKSRFEALKKATENYTIEVTPDDRGSVLQQGGMFVFKGKELLYAWKDEGTGDHAPLEDIFSICCKTPVA
ncbi:prostamide/prostaglandin F synthase [Tanacetum coccineum]|uniref:Prostamide/prostaglandin F synthase n=1 Tax=Tanacetum coccineum TaxID=301880 RepID=A0ABQ5HBM3_9ASTR